MNAPRALPTWSGPVGLAETNSTLTERVSTGAVRPQPAGSARIAAMTVSRAAARRCRFRKPGGATSTDAIGDVAAASPASAASSAGERRRDGQRRHPVWPGELHRQVAREVSVDRIGRTLDLDLGRDRVGRQGRQGAARDRPIPRASDRRPDIGTDRPRGGGITDGVGSQWHSSLLWTLDDGSGPTSPVGRHA